MASLLLLHFYKLITNICWYHAIVKYLFKTLNQVDTIYLNKQTSNTNIFDKKKFIYGILLYIFFYPYLSTCILLVLKCLYYGANFEL